MQGTPFRFEGPVAPELLIDRHAELAQLGRRAGDRVGVRLAAPRRYGKTSLLLAHAAQLRETGLLARLGMSLGTAGASVTVGPRPASPDPEAAETVVYRLLDLPKTLWERDETPTLVVFDEFQDLLVARQDLDGLLRSRIQYHGDAAAYVYAGSEPSMMRELFDVRERPLFGQADPIALGRLPLEEVLADLAARFHSEALDPGDALGELAAFADGHPQRVMLLCYLLAEQLEAGRPGTPEVAALVLDEALERTQAAHQALWGQLSRSEKVVLAGAADGVAPASRALAAEHRLSR